MAQVRLGQSIRNAIAEARPEGLTADVYPPIAEAGADRRAKTAPGRSGSPGPARADLERTLIDVRSELARLGALCQSLRDEILMLGDATDLVRRDVAALREAGRAQAAASWERFDELEIKTRPLIPFDDESWAVRLRDGYAMLPRSEPMFTVMVANAPSGGLEAGTRQVLKALIEPGMVVADVGANVGLLTLACAVATGPTGRVHAFEPEAGPRAQLVKTLRLNGLTWIEVHDCAVGARSERGLFNVSPVIGHSSLYPLPAEEVASGRQETVNVVALDDLLPAGARLDVVKIDVEGAELDVIAGMQRLLSDNADLAIVAEYGPSHLARIGVDPADWFAAFAAHGFETFAIEEPWGVCRPVALADLVGVESVNLAFVRQAGAARDRLPRDAPE
jgi:FkbM family methyltransferase